MAGVTAPAPVCSCSGAGTCQICLDRAEDAKLDRELARRHEAREVAIGSYEGIPLAHPTTALLSDKPLSEAGREALQDVVHAGVKLMRRTEAGRVDYLEVTGKQHSGSKSPTVSPAEAAERKRRTELRWSRQVRRTSAREAVCCEAQHAEKHKKRQRKQARRKKRGW